MERLLANDVVLAHWRLPRRDWNLHEDQDYTERLQSLLSECRKRSSGKTTHETKVLRTDIIPALEKTLGIASKEPDMVLALYQIPDEHWHGAHYTSRDESAEDEEIEIAEHHLEPMLYYVHREIFSALNSVIKSEMLLWDQMEDMAVKYRKACRKLSSAWFKFGLTQIKNWVDHMKSRSPRKRHTNSRALEFVEKHDDGGGGGRSAVASSAGASRSGSKEIDPPDAVVDDMSIRLPPIGEQGPGGGADNNIDGTINETGTADKTVTDTEGTINEEGTHRAERIATDTESQVPKTESEIYPDEFATEGEEVLGDAAAQPPPEGVAASSSSTSGAVAGSSSSAPKVSPAIDDKVFGAWFETQAKDTPEASPQKGFPDVVGGRAGEQDDPVHEAILPEHELEEEEGQDEAEVDVEDMPALRDLTYMPFAEQSMRSLKPSANSVIELQESHLRHLHRCKIRGSNQRLGELFYKQVVVHVDRPNEPVKVRSRLTSKGVAHALHYLYNPRESWKHIPADEFPATLHFFFQLAVSEREMIAQLRRVLTERPQVGCLNLARQYGYDRTRAEQLPKDQIVMRRNADFLNLEEVILSSVARNYDSEDVKHIRGYNALSDEDKIAIAERRIAGLEGLIREPHIRFRTHFRDMLPPGSIEDKPLLPLTTSQRNARSRGYSHHFFAAKAAEEKEAEAKRRAAEAEEERKKEKNRELYFRPRSKSSNFAFHDSRTVGL
ncbi:unnamed protein product [Amoebophrya sp. A120]|nr:unnamed protein product [Amoebophrya sp. A120]|eukprot:GSA120T00005359001.1